MRKYLLIIISLLLPHLTLAQNQKINWTDVESKFKQAKVIDDYTGPMNCWGTLFYLLGVTEKLDYADDDIMFSFLASNKCQKLPSNTSYPAGTIVHIDDGQTARHSYLLGNDGMAWQKFGPDPSYLVYKEPSTQVIKWYNDIFNFRGEISSINYYNCGSPSRKFIELFSLYSDYNSIEPEHQKKFDTYIYAFLNKPNSFDDSELFSLLSIYRTKIESSNKKNMSLQDQNNYIKLTEALLNKPSIERVKRNLQFLFSGFINKYNLDLALSKLNSIVGPQEIDEITFARILNTLSDIDSDTLLSSDNFSHFSDSLKDLSPNKKLYIFHLESNNINSSPLFKRIELEKTIIFQWLVSVAKTWSNEQKISNITYFNLRYLYNIGIIDDPYFEILPDTKQFEKLYHNPELLPFNVFPNSFDLTDDDW